MFSKDMRLHFEQLSHLDCEGAQRIKTLLSQLPGYNYIDVSIKIDNSENVFISINVPNPNNSFDLNKLPLVINRFILYCTQKYTTASGTNYPTYVYVGKKLSFPGFLKTLEQIIENVSTFAENSLVHRL